ncbi:sodium-dependent transporter [Kushneria phosphatilytica]|uniref:Transporter n=1 Tax=Kushneria phosphatilytica TaxID=657387 RepID=A0A1S1NTT7_9GAMM|nr:sodium-dependent transporter [Kushneria phosphatilytica]OHV08871.1 sodium-dependent transporter [Kushneria phosphatilytica]QEL12592.1 sodium-dependent transporter [Kushneria phosphatilytica]
MANKTHIHAQWSSRLAFMMAAVGSSVGLGNVWKFPYMTGESGGGAFVLIYLVSIALIGLPILMSEWLLGRLGQKNPITTMSTIAGRLKRSQAWALVGVSGILAAYLILSFYSVIGGWALAYIKYGVTGTFGGLDGDGVGSLFGNLLASPMRLLGWHSLFMVLTIGVVAGGVSGGLERAAKLLMPALAVLLVVLVGYAATTGSFGEGLNYLFKPDFSRLTGDVWLAALGHAFFTLSLGMGIMMAYGSYLGDDVNIGRTALTVVILDTVIALGAGMAIFPVVFANHLDPAAGPGLVFQTLPLAFGNMSGGLFFGTLFFILLVFAALTSAISLLEPIVEWLEEKSPLTRVQATLVAGGATWLLGIATVLSFNGWSGIQPFGMSILDLLDYLTSKLMLPLTGLATILFVGWVMGRDEVRAQLNMSDRAFTLWRFTARYISPIGVAIVFIFGLLN